MSMKWTTLLVAIGICGMASAGDTEKAAAFSQLDRDGDGQISATEAEADLKVLTRFADADADDNGFLSADEFATVMKKEKAAE